MSLRLFLARHGQTEGAREGRFCGDIDVPLDAQGVAMAEAIGCFYAAYPWRAIYSSPRARARATARPLAEAAGLHVQIEDGVREIAYGAWEGLLEREVAAEHPGAYRAWQADPARHAPPGGETATQIAERAVCALEAIQARHPEGGDVVVFSHKATIRVLACHLLGVDVAEFRRRIASPPGAMTVFDLREGGPLLLALADVRHLPPDLRPALDG